MIGESLGPYRIIEPLGAGGMGEVYRARDAKLDRDVAIKVLPEEFAGDPDRLARFEREAKLLASLNHANIAAIYGLEEEGARRCIVMEVVEGESLAERIVRSGCIDVEEALEIALQIAEALEAAHDSGVIHRDLKPANVVVTPAGKAKVLDFGLAKSYESDGAGSEVAPDVSQSPTMMGATHTGVIMGTAAYMSPEQAKGLAVDRRSDVWAFGVVLYEMLTGDRAFRGDSIVDTMASVLKLEPDFDNLPANLPSGVLRVLRRCLNKDPNRRLHDIADARIEIEEIDLNAPMETAAAQAAPPSARVLPLLAAGALGLVVGGLVVGGLLWPFLGSDSDVRSTNAGNPSPVRRSVIALPEGAPLNRGDSIAISHDGTVLALSAGLDEESRLYLRSLDSFEMEVIPDTEGASFPFFSPDGEYLGFFAGGELKKVSLRGGGRDVTVLCDAPVTRGGTWDANGWIYFTFGESRLARVRADGGDPEELGDAGDVHHVQSLPDGRGILLTLQGADTPSIRKDTSTIAVLSSDGATVTPVLNGGYSARYLSSGHLVFMRGGGLFAVPFDIERLETSPPAVSVQPDVWTDSVWALARYDVSSDGTLVFLPGGDYARTVPTWVDLETGEEEPLPIPAGVYNKLDLSPDGTQLAIQNASGSQDQIYVYDSNRGSFTRLTLDGSNTYPVWSHDAREVFFASSRDGEGYRLYRKPVDGSAPASRLLTDEQEALMDTGLRWPGSATPDGKFLLIYTWGHPTRGGDLWKVPLDGSGDPEAVLATDANEIIPEVSPDGNWLAYLTNSSGPYRIVVRPFPEVGRREWVVSGEDGYDPRWMPGGDSLLYRQGWGRLMRVPIGGGNELAPGVAQELLETDFHDASGSSFAVSPEGKRVMVNKPANDSLMDETPITMVTGWATEVSRLAGPGVD